MGVNERHHSSRGRFTRHLADHTSETGESPLVVVTMETTTHVWTNETGFISENSNRLLLILDLK